MQNIKDLLSKNIDDAVHGLLEISTCTAEELHNKAPELDRYYMGIIEGLIPLAEAVGIPIKSGWTTILAYSQDKDVSFNKH